MKRGVALLVVLGLVDLQGATGASSRRTNGRAAAGRPPAAEFEDENDAGALEDFEEPLGGIEGDIGIDLDERMLEKSSADGKVILPSKRGFVKRLKKPDGGAIGHFAGSMRARVSSTIGEAKHRSTGVMREMKGFLSSELESVILKITRPSDNMPKTKHVENLLGATHDTPAQFEVYPHIFKKLWNRMLEDDWRCALKATYMLHKFSSDGAPQHSVELKKTLASMSRQYCSRHKNTYFNLEQAVSCRGYSDKTGYGPAEQDFLAAYLGYTLFRARTFRPRFEEITSLKTTSERDVAQLQLRMERLLSLAKAMAEGAELVDREVCAVCVEKVLEDVAEMMTVLAKRIEEAVEAEKRAEVEDLLTWYQERVIPLRQWLRSHARLLSKSMGLSPKVTLRKLTFAGPSRASREGGGE